jgi:hypothetical protein
MSSQKIIGPFFPENQEQGIVHLSLVHPVRDLSVEFRRYNLIANYMAEYTAYLFEQKDKVENLVSTIAYEMIGSLAHYAREDTSIDMKFMTLDRDILLEMCLFYAEDKVQTLEKTLNDINGGALESVYMRMLEEESRDDLQTSRFGLVMIAHDYHAEMAVNISQENHFLCLRVRLPQKEIIS